MFVIEARSLYQGLEASLFDEYVGITPEPEPSYPIVKVVPSSSQVTPLPSEAGVANTLPPPIIKAFANSSENINKQIVDLFIIKLFCVGSPTGLTILFFYNFYLTYLCHVGLFEKTYINLKHYRTIIIVLFLYVFFNLFPTMGNQQK